MGSEMGMGDVEVLLRVAGDSSGAQKAVSDWEQKVKSGTATATELFAVNARKMGKSSDDVRASLQAMGATAKEQSLAMATAFGEVPAAIEPAKASVNSFGQAVRSNLGDLLVLRRAVYASFGLVSFGYIISEWGRMADAIKNASLALGGFDAGLRETMALAAKWNDAAVENMGKLTAMQLQHLMTITDAHKRSEEEARFRAQDAQSEASALHKKASALQHQLDLIEAIKKAQRQATAEGEAGAVGMGDMTSTGAIGRLMTLSAQAKAEGIDTSQDLKKLSDQLQAAQLKAMEADRAALQAKLGLMDATERQGKAAITSAHKQETAEHRLEASLIRVNGQLAAAQKQQAALSSEMDNYAARHLTQQIRQIEQESKQAQANIAKAKASRDALNVDIEKRGPLKGSASEMWAGSPRIDKMVLENNQRALKQWQKLVEEGNRKALTSYQQLGEGVRRSFDTINQDLEMMGNRHLRTFGMVGSILQQSIEAEKRSAAASGAAAMSKTQFAIGALKQLAPVKAEVNVAKGLEALGDFNFWSAAQYFAGAAMWGTIGAAQIAGMVSGAGGGSRRGGSGSASRNNGAGGSRQGSSGSGDSGQQVVPGGNFATPPKNGNLTIAILGESEGGHWLAGILDKAVNQGGAQLTATHTIAIPQPMA